MGNWWQTPLGEARLKELQQQSEMQRPAAVSAKRVLPRRRILQRAYQNARYSRLQNDWNPGDTSADSELAQSLKVLRNRSRAVVRDTSYAKRAKSAIVTNVIGSGIRMQAQVRTSRKELSARINGGIEDGFARWSEAENCHTGGRLCFADFERTAVGEIFEAGEVFVRFHYRRFGNSEVPLGLELIEGERVADQLDSAVGFMNANRFRLGIESDEFYRPLSYWMRRRHPTEIRAFGDFDSIERISAADIVHLACVDRWPQTRGEPWMHTILRRLNDMDSYSEAEIERARAQACIVAAIESGEEAADIGEEQEDGSIQFELEPGVIPKLAPGEKLNSQPMTAPNPQLDPFMRYMVREAAAGISISYPSLSGDYSQSNYSSSRMGAGDERDHFKQIQQFFIRAFRWRVHKLWIQQAVLARTLPGISIDEYVATPEKFWQARFRPRGWSYIDPTKEVQAYKDAVRCGFMTQQDVLDNFGTDFEELVEQRKRELELAGAAGLVLDTDPSQVAASGSTQSAPAPAADVTTNPDDQAPAERSNHLRLIHDQ